MLGLYLAFRSGFGSEHLQLQPALAGYYHRSFPFSASQKDCLYGATKEGIWDWALRKLALHSKMAMQHLCGCHVIIYLHMCTLVCLCHELHRAALVYLMFDMVDSMMHAAPHAVCFPTRRGLLGMRQLILTAPKPDLPEPCRSHASLMSPRTFLIACHSGNSLC